MMPTPQGVIDEANKLRETLNAPKVIERWDSNITQNIIYDSSRSNGAIFFVLSFSYAKPQRYFLISL
jgi:hypothetical protein